jgi:hypothetical protein
VKEIKLKLKKEIAATSQFFKKTKPENTNVFRLLGMYPGRDLNPHIFKGYRILSPACLPIPPPGPINFFSRKRKRELIMERKTRLELATSTLARLRSTN